MRVAAMAFLGAQVFVACWRRCRRNIDCDPDSPIMQAAQRVAALPRQRIAGSRDLARLHVNDVTISGCEPC
jgi:hypothetical protein